MAMDAATTGFLFSAGLALLVFIVCFLLFSFIRNSFRDVYQFRRLLHQRKSDADFNGKRVGIPAAVPRSQPFAWISATVSMREDDVVRNIGLDSAMYLRYLRSMLLSFLIVSVISSIILMPTYGTGRFGDPNVMLKPDVDRPANITGLRLITLSNVIPEDSRMWATLLVEIVSAVVFIYFMCGDFKRFAELRRINLYQQNPKNYAVAVFDIPDNQNNHDDIFQRFDTIVPGQVAQVVCAKNNTKSVSVHKKLDTARKNREAAEWLSVNKLSGDRPQSRVGFCGVMRCWESKVDTIEHWEKEQDRLISELAEESAKAKNAPCAVVIFKNKRAASLLMQANMAVDATEYNVAPMSEPNAIHWKAFAIPGYQAEIRRVAVLIFVIALTLFWSIPAAFLAGLISLDKAAEQFAFLKPVINWSPSIKAVVQGTLPAVILAVIVSLIPVVIRLVVSLERIHSIHTIDRKTRDYFYLFTVYSSFFCIVLGASILDEVKSIATNFDVLKLINLLANSVPSQGIFFATYMVIQTGFGTSLELLNPLRLILVSFFKKISKTERQIRNAEANGCNLLLFRKYGTAMLIAFIGIMYTSMAPLLPIMATLYFGWAYLVHKYNLIYNLYEDSDGGGESYPGAFWGTLIAFVLRHAVVLVILGIKKSAAAGFMAIPLIFTVCAGIEIGRRFRRVSKFGSLHDHFTVAKADELPDHYLKLYEQPSLKPGETFNRTGDYINLSGVSEIDDYYEGTRDIPNDFEKSMDGTPTMKSTELDTEQAVVDNSHLDTKI